MLLKVHKDYLPTPKFFKKFIDKTFNQQPANERGMFGGEGQRL